MALDALLFDIDGTLVDTNRAHVRTWQNVLTAHGYHVADDRIGREIGKGGDQLIPAVLGDDAEKEHGDALREAYAEEFRKTAAGPTLAVFPGTRELFAECKRRGLKTVLATSSGKSQLQALEKNCGLKFADVADELVTADDAERSKPAPDIVSAAVKKSGLSPAQCAMVGDTPYDVEAARDAGVVTLGFTCGHYNDGPTLRAAGVRAVYRDPADLLAKLDEALRVCSPGPTQLTNDLLETLMRRALDAAAEGLEAGELSIGCVLARGDGQIIAAAHNAVSATQDKTAHAEMLAFRKAAGKVPADCRDLILVSTLEPCVMCLGASMEAAVDTIVYALPAPSDGGTHRARPPVSPESQMPRIVSGVLADQSRRLFEAWLEKNKIAANRQQLAFVTQLLGSI